jgi:hypothetical protein
MVDIQEVHSEKGSLDSHERLLDNSCPYPLVFSLADELRRVAKGEILSDSWTRDIYSVDANYYTIKPSMIARPSDESDVEKEERKITQSTPGMTTLTCTNDFQTESNPRSTAVVTGSSSGNTYDGYAEG